MATVSIYRNIPLARNSVNRLKVASAELVTQLSPYLVDTYKVSYVKNGVVEIPTVAYNLDACNYLTYYEGGGYIHFAFIDEVIWTSHHGCAISFTEDIFTTYANLVSIYNGHLIKTNSPNVDLSVYRSRGCGDYIPKHFKPLIFDGVLNRKVDTWAYLLCQVNKANRTEETVYIDNITSKVASAGLWYLFNNATELVNYTKSYDWYPGLSEDDVLGIYAIPRWLVSYIATDNVKITTPMGTWNVNQVRGNTPPIELSYDIVPESAKDNKRNKDLWRSPYSYIDINLFGERIKLSPEDVCTELSHLGQVVVKFSISSTPSMTITLQTLKSTTQTSYIYTTLGTINFPKIPTTITNIEGWLSANGLFNIASNIIGSAPNVAGMVAKGVGGMIGNPIQTTTHTTSGSATSAQMCGDSRIWCLLIEPITEEIDSIEKDLRAYGYNYNHYTNLGNIWSGVGDIEWSGVGSSPLYLQCDDVSINGNVPHKCIVEMSDAFRSGVRIYDNINDLKEGKI